jgi:hypothetical protein
MSFVKIDPDTRCWVWAGMVDKVTGYARFQISGRTVYGHRWAYERFVDLVDDDLQCDHLCRNRACVNPWHLEPVTPLENTRRGAGHASKTHCPQGHPYDEVNTYRWNGRRYCLACRKARYAARRAG